MNYLAHLHIADKTQSSLLGNLLGDFVKGNPDKHFSQDVAQGIYLHRYVDSYIDQHDRVLEARQLFKGPSRRFSGIALDMFWDHCLAKEWHRHHDLSLDQFCRHCEGDIQNSGHHDLPAKFIRVNQRIWQDGWLQSYQDMENIEFALNRIATRSPRLAQLTHCIEYLNKHYQHLSDTFSPLYASVLEAAQVRVDSDK